MAGMTSRVGTPASLACAAAEKTKIRASAKMGIVASCTNVRFTKQEFLLR
jgi:hypothetical protein